MGAGTHQCIDTKEVVCSDKPSSLLEGFEQEEAIKDKTTKNLLEYQKSVLSKSLGSLSEKLQLVVSQVINSLSQSDGFNSMFNENGEVKKDVLLKELAKSEEFMSELGEIDKFKTILSSDIPNIKKLEFIWTHSDLNFKDGEIDTFIKANTEKKERDPNRLSEDNENATEIYSLYESEIELQKNGTIDTEKTGNKIKKQVSSVLVSLKTKIQDAVRKRNEKKDEKTPETAGKSKEPTEKTEKLTNGVQEISDKLKSILDFTPTEKTKFSERDKLERAFDLKNIISDEIEKALKAETPKDAGAIIDALETRINGEKGKKGEIDKYMETLKGKTETELKGLMKLKEEKQLDAYIDTIPSAYFNTKYAKMYMEYLKDPEKPLKGFNEFLNENTNIKPLERLFIMIMGLFKDLKANLDFTEEGQEKRDKAKTKRINDLRGFAGFGTIKEAQKPKETKKDIALKIDKLIKNKDKWNDVKIKEFKKDDSEDVDFKKVKTYFTENSADKDFEFMNRVLDAEPNSMLGVARTKGLSLEQLRTLNEHSSSYKEKDSKLLEKGDWCFYEEGIHINKDGETDPNAPRTFVSYNEIDKMFLKNNQ